MFLAGACPSKNGYIRERTDRGPSAGFTKCPATTDAEMLKNPLSQVGEPSYLYTASNIQRKGASGGLQMGDEEAIPFNIV